MSEINASILDKMVETLQQNENMTPKQVEILKAAITLISEKGYYNTSTSEIAKRAGVAEGTIFRHYPTKKDLLVSIVSPVITNFSAPLFAEKFVDQVFIQSYQRFETFLYAFVKNRFEFARTNLPLLQILLQELAFHPEIQVIYKAVFSEKVQPAFDHVLNFFKEKGDLIDIPNDVIIRMSVPTIIGFMITRFIIQPNKDWDDELEIKRTVDFIMNGIGKNEA